MCKAELEAGKTDNAEGEGSLFPRLKRIPGTIESRPGFTSEDVMNPEL
jgi:hypothetical protein